MTGRDDPHRPLLHLTPPAGWMNDPNGLVFFQDHYHAFYQHYPYKPQWGPMHWGHARSRDLLHWEHLPIALAPDQPYERSGKGGCFSGSAVDDRGTLSLLYTAHREQGDDITERQCLAMSTDGIRFEKFQGNPVIAELPPGGWNDFRDPKVWWFGDRYWMVVGSTNEGRALIYLYSSFDLRQWNYLGIAFQGESFQGMMWECPDLFPIGDRHALIVSAVTEDPYKTLYFVGDMDYDRCAFTPHSQGVVDYGSHFYAPQTLGDPWGRRIMIGWMDSWDEKTDPAAHYGWRGALTLPREVLLLADGSLAFEPAREILQLRGTPQTARLLRATAASVRIAGTCFDSVVRFGRCDGATWGIRLTFGKQGEGQVALTFDRARNSLTIDATGFGRASSTSRSAVLSKTPGSLEQARLIFDRSCLEVFADRGRAVFSLRLFPKNPAEASLTVFNADAAVEAWEMR